jgi:hypothetical protein
MQVCRDIGSGRCFLLIENMRSGAKLVINPEGEIKTLDTARLKGIPVLGLKAGIAAELLSRRQFRIYDRYSYQMGSMQD